MSGNYPDGVHEHTRGAPWNIHDVDTCNVCGREYYTDTKPDAPQPDAMTDAPETEHGAAHGFCATCETENSVCRTCGETYLEPFDGACYDATDTRQCLDCARAAYREKPDNRRAVVFVDTFAPHEKTETCATCENRTRKRYGYTDGLTVPAARTAFVPLCRDCAARDVMTTLLILERLRPFTFEFSLSCSRCAGRGYNPETHETDTCFMCDGTGRENMAHGCKRCRTSGRVWNGRAAVDCDTCWGAGLTRGTCETCGEPLPLNFCGATCPHCDRPWSLGE